MTTPISAILTIFMLTATFCHAQNYEPLDLAKKLFGKERFEKRNGYTTGEYKENKGKPNGQDLRKGATTKFTLLEQTEQTAVVAMTILDSSGKGADTYLHFEKDDVWKMSAFRALAMTGIIEGVIAELERMTPQEIDEIIADTTKNEFNSREEYNFLLSNSKLTLELDDNIVNHFTANQAEFERIKNLALAPFENEDEEGFVEFVKNSEADYHKLFIHSVTMGDDYALGHCINFLIGGILDNAVGYIYVTDKKDLPKMNPNRVIMLREIGNGWYLYKTT